MNIRHAVPLAPLTTLGVGGVASHVARVSSETVADAVRYAIDHGLPLLVLGGGSNLLVSDDGVRALVVQFTDVDISHTDDGLLSVDGGTPWDAVVRHSIAHALAGIECLSGVPGTAGAAPVQNIGCYGQQISDTLERVEAVDLRDGSPVSFSASECGFGYRSSIFNTTAAGQYLVTRIHLRLRPSGTATLAYADLSHLPQTASLASVREAVLVARRRKGMLYSPDGTTHRSAGSFFRNPVVPVGSVPHGAPSWPQPDGLAKVSAAWLIEHTGFVRGDRIGGAAISPDHALSLINIGTATAIDVFLLARSIRDHVRAATGITLEPEVRLWGFSEQL
jgi:UDP-N-acetylmuramate dehydrogenase